MPFSSPFIFSSFSSAIWNFSSLCRAAADLALLLNVWCCCLPYFSFSSRGATWIGIYIYIWYGDPCDSPSASDSVCLVIFNHSLRTLCSRTFHSRFILYFYHRSTVAYVINPIPFCHIVFLLFSVNLCFLAVYFFFHTFYSLFFCYQSISKSSNQCTISIGFVLTDVHFWNDNITTRFRSIVSRIQNSHWLTHKEKNNHDTLPQSGGERNTLRKHHQQQQQWWLRIQKKSRNYCFK